jgi:hypothetical protein
MIDIRLKIHGKEMAIQSDAYNYIFGEVARRTPSKSRKRKVEDGETEEYLMAPSFYGDIKDLIYGVRRYTIRHSDAKTIREMIQVIRQSDDVVRGIADSM